MHYCPDNETKIEFIFLIHIRNLSHFEQLKQDKKIAKEEKGKSERRLIL